MFSYVFCDGMKLIQDAILLRLASPYVLSSWGFGLCSCRRNLPAQAGLSDNKKRRRLSSFSTSTVTLYLVWRKGGRGSKNYQEIKRGRWTNSAFVNWRTLHNNFPSEAHFSVPLLITIGQSLTVVAKFLDLDNDGHCIFERWKRKVWTTVLLLSAIVHRLRRCQYFFGFFFLPYLQDLGLLKSRNFARMATWLNDFFLSFMKGTCLSLGGLPHSLAPNMLASRNSR